ncbi:MAG: hypothetical protein ABS79_06395 [Planctomycetes bacterium SCN 63-9]|nr:MAG: hypothetical protein ABS79_06395 [Planctomycetes bacterium SCN 63-9]
MNLSGNVARLSRRSFLAASIAGAFGRFSAGVSAQSDRPKPETVTDDEKEAVAIEDYARKVLLGSVRQDSSDHFLVVGDASMAYQREVLGFCEGLGKEFLSYYNSRGFNVAYPQYRLSVVVLKDRNSYGAWIGEPAEDAVGGHYDRDTNRLVVFDFRNDPKGLGEQARIVNSFTLSHEANHLLGFNSGLLSRTTDTPTSIIEGLATIGELYQKVGHSAVGGNNRPRLGALVDATRAGEPWIDVSTLIAKDEVCEAAETRQLAYAESWLLLSMMIKQKDKLPRLHAYLDRLRKPRENVDRVRDAEADLGSLDRLNRELKNYAKPYLRG